MKILKDLNEKYNFKKYIESEDIKNCKDILGDISNKKINTNFTNLDLIKKSDMYNDDKQKTNLYNDLEFFTDYTNGDKTIFNKINKTYTNGGSLLLKELLLNPNSNIDYLNLKKNSLEELFNLIKINENDILIKLENLKKYENNIFWILEENSIETESLINILFFNGYLMKNLNNSSHILTAKNYFKIFVSPVLGILSPLLYILTPFLVIRFKFKLKLSFIAYAKFVYNYYVNMNFGNILNVFLSPKVEINLASLKRNVYASSSCGLCGKASIESLQNNFEQLSKCEPTVGVETIITLPDKLRSKQATFDKTGGLHAAALFDSAGELLVLREDVGRHNAVDKILGHAILKGSLPLEGCVLMVSGRVSFEILQKALAGRIEIVCAVSAPSSLAVDVAQDCGQTLIGFLRDGKFNVYSHKERIIGLKI